MEHALCPLDTDVSLSDGATHQFQYPYTDKNRNRKTATARVACPFGLSPNDELYLYGLLSLTFSQPEPSFDFYATPHWCLKQLGIVDRQNQQQKRYAIFREAVRRLSGVVYENDRFYDPLRGEHRDVTFGFLKFSLPIDPASSRAWHFVWDPQFFRFCQATSGSFRFGMPMYRSLDYGSRRLFLLLQKIFWRNDHSPAFDLRQLGTQTLGFSASLSTSDIKRKVARIAARLLKGQVIQLPLGASGIGDLFHKRSKGVHEVRFHKGPYFLRDHTPHAAIDSPLVEPLTAIGFEPRAIGRILDRYSHRLIQDWADITLAAVERGMIKQSPPAYFMHYVQEAAAKRTTPPDWWRAARSQEFRAQQSEATSASSADQQFETYLAGEAHEAFERVTQRLFERLQSDGQTASTAMRNAEDLARAQLRREFLDQNPTLDRERPTKISDVLKRSLHD